jgi:hypothetical protein
MIRAVEKVHERLRATTDALECANIEYAVAGDNAVAEWVSRIDPAAIRNSKDIEILVPRKQFEDAQGILSSRGLSHKDLRIIIAGENGIPNTSGCKEGDHFRVLSVEALVRMKLTANRDKDRTHLRDLIDVGLLDTSILDHLPAELRSRMQHIFDTPEG